MPPVVRHQGRALRAVRGRDASAIPTSSRPSPASATTPTAPSPRTRRSTAQRILPPDFTYTPVRSVRPGPTQMEDIFRVISYGVFPVMPAWRGAGLSEKDIWAIAHYVKSLIDLRGTPAAQALKVKLNASAGFQIPAPPPPPAEPAADADAGAPADATVDGGSAEKKTEKKDAKPEKK